MRFDTHVCLVSDQATPNLTPVLAADFRPKEVVMLVSERMKGKAEALAAVMRRYQVKITILPVGDAYDIAGMIDTLVAYLDKNEDKPVALNLTGGTKTMTIAAQSAFAMAGNPNIFYVRPDNNQVIFVGGDAAPESFMLDCKLKLDDYLAAHGYAITGTVCRSLSEPYADLTHTLVQNVRSFSGAIGHLNKLANDAEQLERKQKRPCLEVRLDYSDPNMDRLLDWFAGAGVLDVRSNTIRFRNADARFYANGGWFEEHVFGVVRSLRGLQDAAINLKVENRLGDGHAANELDVAFLSGNRLHLIECKTRNFTSGNARADDSLYKLDSLTMMGGLNTRGMLVSYRELNPADRQRAKDLRIKVVDGHQLHDLKNQLQSWIAA